MLLVLSTLSEYVTRAVSIGRPRPPPVNGTEVDEDGNVVTSSSLQLVLRSFYRNLLLLLSAGE